MQIKLSTQLMLVKAEGPTTHLIRKHGERDPHILHSGIKNLLIIIVYKKFNK